MTFCNIAPSVRALLRPAAWSRSCEAGPSRLTATHHCLPRRTFQSGSAIRSPGQGDNDALTSTNGFSTTQIPHDASAETPEAHSVSEKAQATREARDPYSLSEDFLRDAAEENALDGKLQNGGGLEYTYNRDDGDGEQSRRWLDALTEAIPDPTMASGARAVRPVPLSRDATTSQNPSSYLPDGSIKSRLTTTWNVSKPLASRPPRIPKGIHQKNKRLQGMTQSESEAIAELLRSTVSPSYSPFASIGDLSGSASAYGARRDGQSGMYDFDPDVSGGRGGAFGSYGNMPSYSAKAIRARRRLTERPDDPNREIIEERLEELKEDAMAGQTDVDLLEWAKRRLFVQEKLPDGTEGFHPVYPHALAFLLDTLRRRFQSPHLVLTVFAYAQNLSPESYIAGCLAPAYNELLWAKWESFRDIEGVEQTIREMEANGVKWDKGTYQVVNEVATVVGKDVYEHGLAKRWGDNVYQILANLDRKAASDVDQQEVIYALQKKERARKRQERTMMEYQQRRGGAAQGSWEASQY